MFKLVYCQHFEFLQQFLSMKRIIPIGHTTPLTGMLEI